MKAGWVLGVICLGWSLAASADVTVLTQENVRGYTYSSAYDVSIVDVPIYDLPCPGCGSGKYLATLTIALQGDPSSLQIQQRFENRGEADQWGQGWEATLAGIQSAAPERCGERWQREYCLPTLTVTTSGTGLEDSEWGSELAP